MAILIPSKNIYDNQNPKVRHNVIERIEVQTVEVVPNNEYETAVYNEKLNILENFKDQDSTGMSQAAFNSNISDYPIVASGSKIFDKYIVTDITIKRQKDNSYISKLYTKTRQSGGNYIQISKKFEEKGYYYQVDNSFTVTADFTDENQNGGYFNFGIIKNYIGEKESIHNEEISDIRKLRVAFTLYDDDPKVGFVDKFTVPTIEEFNAYDILSVTDTTMAGASLYTNSYQNLALTETNLGGELEIEENKEYYTIKNLKIFVGRKIYSCASALYSSIPPTFPSTYSSKVVEIEQNVLQAEITVYGNTIGIDLKDKTLSIQEAGKNTKKVLSFDSNELMQTSNYYQSTDTNAIERAFNLTRQKYSKGKETATILCSISDYYDYDSGEKKIAIDNSTGKMSFKMYDQVIPMVYGADGKDRPMSTYQDGSPKVFSVLGTNIFYDGAVWQELSLQEVDKTQINMI